MARYDVFPNPGASERVTPYLLDVQSDLLDALDSRMVIPLRRARDFPAFAKRPERLLPAMKIGNEVFMLETPKMAAVPARVLKAPFASLAAERERITAALDFLFQGF
ncbi:plasmid maintenance protein CcdB [Betaproteobacteria bacterium]|nr:plasmid maintenance protein CcdB [Betaproteobacteria bacterium]